MDTLTEDGRSTLHLHPNWLTDAAEDSTPLSLTASDGTGLLLTAMRARVHIQDPLALTELTLTFDNPEDRELEGRFAITLPPGAAVSRFAMKIGDRWQEGEVVEKQRARRIYEDFLHRAQDPALMEKAPGNHFTARVYPIPPRASKKIRISWSQELPSAELPYTLFLRGLPTLASLSVEATLESWEDAPPDRFTFEEKNHHPVGDLVFSLGGSPEQVGLRSEDLLVARLKLDLDTPPQPITALTVLLDTSASQALTLPASLDGLDRLLADLTARGAGGMPLCVRAFDQTCRTLYDGSLASYQRPTSLSAMGASDLSGALSSTRCADRLILITDGLPTAGERTPDGLFEALQHTGAVRLDALVVGGIRDEDTLTGLVQGVLLHDGVVRDLSIPDLARSIEQATRSGITIAMPGAGWVWPTQLDGVQPGDEVLVYASLPPHMPARFQITGARPQGRIAVAAVARPLLARAAAQAHIRALEQQSAQTAAERAARNERIIALSVEHRVLCELTALLVLETAADYERHGLDRSALSDILTIDDSGITLLDARQPVLKPTPPAPKADKVKKSAKIKKKGRRSRRSNSDERSDPDAFMADTGAVYDEAEAEVENPPAMEMSLYEDSVSDHEPEPEMDIDDAVEEVTGEASAKSADDEEPQAPRRRPPAPPRVARPGTVRSPSPARGLRTVTISSAPEPVAAPTPASTAPTTSPIPERLVPLSGPFKAIHDQIQAGHLAAAVADAQQWRAQDPGNVLALLALGRALEASDAPQQAARAYGSLIDLYAGRADLRRVAGERLERLEAGRALSIDTFAAATQQRPDHPSGHRLYAWALVRSGALEAAFEAMCAGLTAPWKDDRYPAVRRVMREELGLIAAAWIAASPLNEATIRARLVEAGGVWPTGSSTRLVLSWETDANDVDLHVYDAAGNHCYYSSKTLASGGQLYADVTTGYGPECFVIEGEPTAGPYRVQAHYYRRGPMGYGTGTLQIITHDGRGGLKVASRPFVIMIDNGWIDLGTVHH